MTIGLPVLLVLIAAGLAPTDPTDTRDLALMAAVESFVLESPRRPLRWVDVLPPVQVDLIHRLGCEHYACRRAALRELHALDDGPAFRLLWWGRRAIDPEAADACRVEYARRYQCPNCRGAGVDPACSYCHGRGMDPWIGAAPCERCGGTGADPAPVGACPTCQGLGAAYRFLPDR